jgi:prevent-host-death family protein
MKAITAAEANRRFSEVLRRASRGESVLITSRGKAVATLIPATQVRQDRQSAKAALLARLARRKATGKRNWTRDELYDDHA